MTPRERVLAALRRQEPDRIPVGEFATDHEMVEAVLGRPTFYRGHFKTTRALWEGRRDEVVDSMKRDLVEYTLKLELDMVPVQLVPARGADPCPMECISQDLYRDRDGSIWRYAAGSHWLLCVQRADQDREFTPEDFAYREPAPPDPSQFELIDYVREKLGDTHFLFARSADGSFDLPGGMERGLAMLADDPDLVALALETATTRAIATDRAFFGAGIDALAPGADYATTRGPMLSPRLFEKLILPQMRRHVEAAHAAGMLVLKHACGNNRQLMPFLVAAGYDAYQSIQQSAGMDMAWLKREYGNRIALWGGVPTETLMHGSMDETRDAVRQAIRDAADGGGLILGSSHSIAIGTRYDNYMAMLDECRAAGARPTA